MSETPDDTSWYAHTSSTQTMRTWARRITDLEELPYSFLRVFPRDISFDETIYLPEDPYSLFHKRNEQLLGLHDDMLLHMELNRGEMVIRELPLSELLYLKSGRFLLQSWLQLVGREARLHIPYSTTCDLLLTPLIERIRERMCSPLQPPEREQQDKALERLSYLQNSNFKYMNYARNSVRDNDHVVVSVYQPGWIPSSGANPETSRPEEHLTLLTAQELILISDDVTDAGTGRHGGILSFIPRNRISSLEVVTSDRETRMTVSIAGSQAVTLLFDIQSESYLSEIHTPAD